MKLSVKAFTLAFSLLGAISFLFVALMNLLLPPYGGAQLAVLTSLYPGYDPVAEPLSMVIGAFYASIAGAASGATLAWVYNFFVQKFGE